MRLLAFCLALLMPLSAAAQDRTNTILVLDGSGSMWGQIDGTAKITIAQDVVRDLLGTLPDTQELGLTVYGHRARGDCTDIETIVAPGAGTRAAIATAVGGIKPLGKTPMTDAVIAAANALRFTEEKATVVLVSDGVETCNPDPCAAARALEADGIDFTAHVVGFDVGADPEALAQMQCIAAETGGQFLTAENATELSTALVKVAAEPAPHAPLTVTFRGRAGPGGPVITDPLVWSIAGPDGQIADAQQAPNLAFELPPGDYRVAALWPQFEEIVELTARVAQDGIVDVVFPAPPPPPVEVTFRATEGRNGPQIDDPLDWAFFQGDAQLGETLTGATITGTLPRGAYRVVVTRPVDGARAEETFGVGTVNATVTLVLPEFLPAATLDAPGEVVAGSTFDVIWTGPDEELDYIATAQPDARPGAYETYTYTREGPLLKLLAPATPGEYRLQYVLRDGAKVLSDQALVVVPVAATLSAPDTGIAGQTITVEWTGPDYELDYIAVSKLGDRDGVYENYTYTREGTPLQVVMPTEPG
ncbi:MAG: VWA domain-containing protein, partial [Pseudomonadota bacterium]